MDEITWIRKDVYSDRKVNALDVPFGYEDLACLVAEEPHFVLGDQLEPPELLDQLVEVVDGIAAVCVKSHQFIKGLKEYMWKYE